MDFLGLTPENNLWEKTIVFADSCTWSAGSYLANLMRQNAFHGNERVFIAMEDGNIAGFCTFTEKDALPEEYGLSPFIGFVFVDEKYRGNRISEKLIKSVITYAKGLGVTRIFLTSGEQGLYEKYGFEKIGDCTTIFGDDESIFAINI